MGILRKSKKEEKTTKKFGFLAKKEEPQDNALTVEVSEKKPAKTYTVTDVKNKAVDTFTSAVDKEKAISKKLAFWSMVYEVVMMLAYTALTVVSVFTNWSDANNPLLMSGLLVLYVGAFVVMTAYTVKSMRSEEMSYDAKKNTVKNYKSISVIVKKIMKVISVGISIMLAIETWNDGNAYRVVAIILLVSSILAFFKAISGIFKEIKKMKKRSKPQKESKIMSAKHKIESYSDELKEKRQREKDVE